jgi:AcrR family transcriptional regulator
MDEPRDDPPPSLAQERQDLTRARIREAAMKVVARRGFDATVAEIAELSGVSPRTIFRHYASHDRLIAATVKDMYDAWGRRPIPGLPTPDADLDGWLEGLATVIHTRSADIIGEAFWDLHAPNPDASEVLGEVDAIRHEYRVRGIRYLTGLAWQTAGGEGEPPESLVLVFGIHLSGFATHALMTDFDQTPQQIGALTAEILKMSLGRALQQQRPPPPPGEDGS